MHRSDVLADGGDEALAAAFAEPPRTSEQVLDPVVPLLAADGDDAVGRELLGQRPAELTTRSGYEHAPASRGDRIGESVLQRCLTRGSAQHRPCSSGAAASYSSVTW